MTVATKKVKSRTVKEHCSYEEVKHLIDNQETEIISYAKGSLIDNYILTSEHGFNFGKKQYDYIILKELYLNCWSSSYNMILTNDTKIVREHIELFEEYENEDL